MKSCCALLLSVALSVSLLACADSESEDSGPRCSDGVVEGSEQCDDGNSDSGDGCSSGCRAESGWDCADGTCKTICGDKRVAGEEVCDPGSSPGYCSDDCSQVIGSCGDGTVQQDAFETCDAGGGQLRGCSALCRDKLGFKCDGQKNSCTGSGLPGDKVASTMSDAELTQYCTWLIGVLGGEGHVWECSGYQITNNSVATCVAKQKENWGDVGKCTIGQIEDWVGNSGSACTVMTSTTPVC